MTFINTTAAFTATTVFSPADGTLLTIPEFIRQLLQRGRWERFISPEHGEYVVLYLGNAPQFTVYLNAFQSYKDLTDRSLTNDMVAAAFVRQGLLAAQLEKAIELLAGDHADD